MGRAPCCDKANVKKGPWSPEEDEKLKSYIENHGTGGNWIALPQKIGLKRCGKSCRLRWLNYLRPNIKHGAFSDEEDSIICSLYIAIGSRWSIIAAQLPGRTDNDIKNHWNTKLKTMLLGKHRGGKNQNRSARRACNNIYMNNHAEALINNYNADHHHMQQAAANNIAGAPAAAALVTPAAAAHEAASNYSALQLQLPEYYSLIQMRAAAAAAAADHHQHVIRFPFYAGASTTGAGHQVAPSFTIPQLAAMHDHQPAPDPAAMPAFSWIHETSALIFNHASPPPPPTWPNPVCPPPAHDHDEGVIYGSTMKLQELGMINCFYGNGMGGFIN